MSGNQKQASGIVSQPQTRYPQGPFIPSRPPTPQRTTDGYHVTTPPTFVAQQPPNQGNNQGPNLRSMAPTGPPNTASTPPNTDLKVQQMPQASVNLTAYMPQTAQVRATGQNYYSRPPPPQTQTIRPNHRQGNQPIYPPTQMQYLPIGMQHVYPNTNVSFQFNQRPATGYVQPYQSIPAQAISSYPYPQTQTPQQIYAYTFPAQIVQRQGPPPPVATAPQNHTQTNPSTMVLTQNSQQTGMQQKNRRRAKAIPIIDPDTGKDKLKEMFEQQEQDESHPASGESSARQTPQPSVPNPNKEVQAAFAKQVAQAISNEETSLVNQHHSHLETSDHHYSHSHHTQPPQQQQQHQHHQQQQQQQHTQAPHHQQSTTIATPAEYVAAFPTHHHPAQQHAHSPSGSIMLQTNVSNHPQAVQNNGRLDQIVLTSSLKAQAKEFVSQTAKEMTPVVSALTDSEEVTISKQPPKDRESPAKSRKQQQAQREQQPKEQPAPPKDAFICEKPPATASVVGGSGSGNVIKDETSSRSSLSPQQPQQKNDIPTCSGDAGGAATSVHYQQQNVAGSGNKQHQQEVEKKNSKKDKTLPQSVPDQEMVDSSPTLATTTSSVGQLTSENTPVVSGSKSKQNAAQKSKDNQKQTNHQQQQQQVTGSGGGFISTTPSNANKPPQTVTSLPVPQSQPAKANNKTNKMRELNQKGQLKQGSDMDAFSDDVAPAVVATKNNATSENGNKLPLAAAELVNTNTTVIVENSKITNEKLVEKTPTPVSTANNNHVAALPTSASSTPSVPIMPTKPRIDVTSIVANMAPAPVAFTATVDSTTAAPTLSRDETDRATVIANDKLVQAKNKANRTPPVTIDHNNVIDTKNNTTYKEVPISEGKKVYTFEDLLALKNSPASRKKPENCRIPPDLLSSGDDRARIGDINRFAVRNTPDFAPQFSSGAGTYPGRGSSQRGPVVNKRGSQSGKPSGTSKGGKQSVIKVSISVKEDVKLHETENAWRPARLVMGANMTEDDKKTEQLYRKVRGILNKLTPQKFETLLGQIQSLTIDTCERLQGVIDLVFEKAVDEPNFSVAYALLCRELALMQVPNSEEVRKDGHEFVNFRKLLITRCQREFEKNSIDEAERNIKVKEIEECTDPEKKKELQLELEEYDRRLRMKSVGNIRFIGELYKQQMLTGAIMLRCIVNLLDNKDEESLECLCKLLSTIGKELESKNMDLNPYFNTMKELVNKKHGKISSRVRFMLQDVIDLRNAKWVPRRQDMKPRTIDQIQKEAENEHMTNQALNALPLPKREERGPTMSGSVKKIRNVTDDNGWSTARGSRPSPFAISSDKLKNRVPPLNEPLGPSSNFDMWSKGSAMSKAGSTTATSTTNMYAPLENLADAEKRGTRPNKDPYATKTSLERFAKFDDGRGSRSSSQQRSRDSSTTSQRSGAGGGSRSSVIPPPQMPSLTKVQSAPPPQTTRPAPSFDVEITPELLQRRLKNILDEYLNDCCTISECEEEITTTIPKSAHSNLVSDGYNGVLERSKTARMRTGELFAHLIKRRTLSLEDYCKGLEEVLSVADDLTIDIPKIWDYLAEIIVPLITEESITFKVLHKCCELLITQSHSADLLAPLFQLIVQIKGAGFLQSQWRESGLRLEDFLPDTDINKFVSDAKVEFLLDTSGNVPSYKPTLSGEEITEKLLSFFNADASFDEVKKWIETNLGDVVQEPYFIKALVTAIFQYSIVGNKLKDDLFKKHYTCLHRFVVGSSEREIQCLYAVQALLNKMEYPQGLLLTIFEKLYEENVIPHESFISWEDSKDPAEQAGKGVALKQLTSFFTSLKEADDETGSSASEEP